ncbi:YveK family protein [Clostridium sp. CF012]|uniref:YveK family protein n=1 Tax=Clostridium sp. CF012 TaxID=2843319 RepID=UPI001C0DFCDA|nr:Wzz/FepE/Etk N-terminal domain-containing protein [Clostridium sp. CF012]MBU3142583.1 lipopolysaccharide biosynthesis protein [Clostridium sp. CF012]
MEFKDYFYILRKRFILIFLITLIVTLATGAFNYYVIRPTYKADISVIIGDINHGYDATIQDYNDILMYQKMVKTYSKLAKSRIVLEDVIEKLKAQPMKPADLLLMTSVEADEETEFLTITVKSGDPSQAMNIANQFAKSLKEVGAEVKSVDSVKLIDKAILPSTPDSPHKARNIIMACFLGLMFSIGLVFALEYLDNTIKTKEEVEKIFGLHVIGTISLVKTKNKDVMIC